MDKNHVPKQDVTKNTTGCCPQFDPTLWDGISLSFEDKLFVKDTSHSFLFMPLNLGKVMTRTWGAIEKADAKDASEFIVMSQDVSPWKCDHYFAVSKEVPGANNVKLTGEYLVKVFEGPYQNVKKWCGELQQLAKSKGSEPKNLYFYYTTCPKCAKAYGKNYVVGLVQIS